MSAPSPVGGGGAINAEYGALLGAGITELQVRRAIRLNPSVREALRSALGTPASTLQFASELSRGEASQRSTGELFAALCAASQERVRQALGAPPASKTWDALLARCKLQGTELLANTIVCAEHNQEALAQRLEALEAAGRRYAELSERGRAKIVSLTTTYGQAALGWEQLAQYSCARKEAAELIAAVDAQLAKERAAEAKRTVKTDSSPLVIPSIPKSDPHKKRQTDHAYRRTVARKG